MKYKIITNLLVRIRRKGTECKGDHVGGGGRPTAYGGSVRENGEGRRRQPEFSTSVLRIS